MKPLIVVILLFFSGRAIAQEQTSALLYTIYQAKNDRSLFTAVEAIKKLQKDSLMARIKALSNSSKADIIKNAGQVAAVPWSVLTWGQFNAFHTTGNRVDYEHHYFSRRQKLNTLIIGELVANDGRYLPEIVNGLGLICEESTWALPAHMSLQKAGNGLPDVNDPIIDLFAAQTAMTLSYAKYLLSDQLTQYSPILLPRLDAELKKRIFDPYLKRNDFWWMGFNTSRRMNNWNIFINTNVLSAAILAENDPGRRKLMIEKSIQSVDHFLGSYPADGGCDEGPSYWGMAGGQLIAYIDMLSVYSGRKLDFSTTQLIHRIGAYLYKVHIDQNYYVNFADAAVANAQDFVKIYKYGRLFKDEQLLQFAAYLRQINKGAENFDLGNVNNFVNVLAIRDAFTKLKPVAPQLRYVWLNDIQILTARQEQGNAKGLFFAAKGGHNAESHNHNDIGNFVIYKDGTPLVVDAGVGVYTRETFSSSRYKLWYMQSDWHNCPTINGVGQQAGRNYEAKSVSAESRGNLSRLTMDIAPAYPDAAGVSSWIRTFEFNHQAGIIRLKENFLLKRFQQSPSLNFLVNGTVTTVKKGMLKLTNAQGKTIVLIYDPLKFDERVEIKKIDDARLSVSWHNDLNRIILKAKSTALKGSHQIEFRNE